MVFDPSWNFQKAIYSALSADAGVIAALVAADGTAGAVYDEVPESGSTPARHIAIGDDTCRDWDVKSRDGMEIILDIFVEVRDYQGRKGVKDVLAAIYARLHRAGMADAGAAITGTGFTVTLLRFVSAETERDTDEPHTYVARAQYLALLAITQ
jgi:hypothetical protein